MYEFGYFEGKTNFNSVVIIDEDADEKMVDELRKYLNAYRTNSAWGITLLEKSGLVLRVMGKALMQTISSCGILSSIIEKRFWDSKHWICGRANILSWGGKNEYFC